MKSLDEVIKACELCNGDYCSDSNGSCAFFHNGEKGCQTELRIDVLYYLKKLKELESRRRVIAPRHFKEQE